MASRRACGPSAAALQVLSLNNVIGHTASKQTEIINGNIRPSGPMRCCIPGRTRAARVAGAAIMAGAIRNANSNSAAPAAARSSGNGKRASTKRR
jgi:hypothetical protein